MSEAIWVDGPITYRVHGLREKGTEVRRRADLLGDQIHARAAAATAALRDLRGPVAVVFRDQVARALEIEEEVVTELQRFAGTCSCWPAARSAMGTTPAPRLPAADGRRTVSSGDITTLRRYASQSGAWEGALRGCATLVDLDGVTATAEATPGATGVATDPMIAEPPRPVDPRRIVELPAIVGPVAIAVELSQGAAHLAVTAAHAFDEADLVRRGRRSTLALDAELAVLRRDHGLTFAGLNEEISGYWQRSALHSAGISDAELEHMGPAVMEKMYESYTRTALALPDLEWASLAGFPGATFAGAVVDIREIRAHARDLVDRVPVAARKALFLAIPGLELLVSMTDQEAARFQARLPQMGQEIFLDMAPAFSAYATGGLDAVRAMHARGLLSDDQWAAFQLTERGRATGDQASILAATQLFGRHEQSEIISDDWDALDSTPVGHAVTVLMSAFGRLPIPGATTMGEDHPTTITVDTPGPKRITTPFLPLPHLPGAPSPALPRLDVDNPTQVRITVTAPVPTTNVADREDRLAQTERIVDTFHRWRTGHPGQLAAVLATPMHERIEAGRTDVTEVIARTLDDIHVEVDQTPGR